ncbi:MAG: BNR/Asp-box repeat protein [Actinoallomurus sp.]|nr:BNR/Asp-box repeat protein [Actinoallomurus sp.]
MKLRASLSAAGAALLSAAAFVSATPAGADTQPVRLVSPGDPYANCTIGASQNGVGYPSAEVEPWVSVDPHNPRRAIGVFQQDRWSDGGAKGLVATYTSDGKHFTESPLPFSACAPEGVNYQRASDAWVSFGPDGVAYASGLTFDATTPRNGVAAATSYDGGKTWKHLSQLIADTNPAIVDDKNSVTADPVHAGVAYQVWDRIDQVTSGSNAHYNGPSYIAITRDHGRTWTPAHPFVDTSVIPNSQTIGNVIVADPRNDTLYDFFESQTYTDVNATTPSDLHFAVVKSTDQGRTWTKPTRIATDSSIFEVDPNAPDDPKKALRAGANLISPAIDPKTGELYATYEGTDFTGGKYNDIQLVHSTDGGRTWSAPVRINQAPNAPAFTPSIAVNSHGTVAITYYDLRYLQPGNTTTLPTAMWYATFPRGGANYLAERRISKVFDWLQAPFAGWGHFLGDYEGIAVSGGEFRPILIETNNSAQNSTDAFSGLLAPNGVSAPHPAPAAPNLTTPPHLNAHRFQH